jgi:Nucleotidyl transferase AbiEii toxin, Type IV TA system
MLDDVRHDDGGHLFIVKGGTAMQLRLGISARATTNLDVAFRGHFDEWLERFDAATADTTWSGFTVTRKSEPTPIDIPGLGYYTPWRVPLQVRYGGREFGTIAFEVAIDEPSTRHHELIEPAGIALAAFSIDPPGLVPCRDVPNQIAQKIHACPNRERAITSVSATSSTSGCSKRFSSRNSSPR